MFTPARAAPVGTLSTLGLADGLAGPLTGAAGNPVIEIADVVHVGSGIEGVRFS